MFVHKRKRSFLEFVIEGIVYATTWNKYITAPTEVLCSAEEITSDIVVDKTSKMKRTRLKQVRTNLVKGRFFKEYVSVKLNTDEAEKI